MVETIQISNIQQFEDWKVKKSRKEWQSSTILFVCEICKKEINIKGRNFKDFICRSCRKSNTEAKKSIYQKQQENQKRKETLIRKYGADSLMNIPDVQKKCKQIFLEKYGVENPAQSELVKEKIKQSNLKKYGVASTNQVSFIKEKQNLKKKDAWVNDKESIVLKKRKTLKEKYNDSFYNNVSKIKQTKKEKYGNENYNNLDQAKKTNLEKYGNEYYSKTEIGKERAKNHWVNMDSEKRKIQLEKCKQTWAQKTPEELKAIRSKAIKKYGCYYSQTEDGKNRLKEYWKGLSMENKKVRAGKCKQTWDQKTPEEKKIIRQKSIKKYVYQNIEYFDSSWELALWIYAKDHSLSIEREPIVLKYVFEEKEHTYYPDFLFDGKLIEIKGPQFFAKDGTMQNPFDHSKDALFEAKHQCGLKNGVEFWSKKEMKPILKYVEKIYTKDFMHLFRC